MKKLTVSAIAIAAISVAMIQPSHARVCGDRLALIKALDADYNEAPVAMALTSAGNVLEILVSEDGTFTALVTEPNGRTCVVEVGTSWQLLEIKKELGPGA